MSAPDISRFLRQPGKHYAGARLQQGRVLTDADYNEGAWLGEEDRRRALGDFIGPRGSPDQGFSIGEPLDLQNPAPPQPPALHPGDVIATEPFLLNGESVPVRPVSVRAGTFYVGGMRCALESPQPIMFQRDFLQMTRADIPLSDLAQSEQLGCFYYLNAWEQCVSAVEDGEFLEPALGGVDTSLRVRRMRRVQLRSNPAETSCEQAFAGLVADLEADNARFNPATGELVSRGRLFLSPAGPGSGPDCAVCNPSPSARFLGADNQTLRIMLTAADRFVWAMDDASPLYRAEVSNLGEQSPAEVRVTLLTPPRDEEHFPLEGRVVEILPLAALLDSQEVGDSRTDPHFNKAAAEMGAFTRVVVPYDPVSQSFTVDLDAPGMDTVRAFVHEWDLRHPDAEQLMVPPPASGPPPDARAFYVRFWHLAHQSQNEPIEIPIDPSTLAGPTLGTTGLIPNFPSAGRAGDFWIAALRPDAPDRPVFPFDLFVRPDQPPSEGLPPDGPHHFYAPLAFVSGAQGNQVDENADCRPLMRPLADDACTTVTVGDCRTSVGQFDVIQDAVDALPPEGGLVSILPGFYQQRVIIQDRPGVILEGCGAETVIVSPDLLDPVIAIGGVSPGTRIRALTLNAAGGAIAAGVGADDLKLSALHVVAGTLDISGNFHPDIGVSGPALVSVEGSTGVSMEAVKIDDGGRLAIALGACAGVEATGLDVVGSAITTQSGTPPAIRIDNCSGVTLRDSSVHTFGQVGVAVQNDSENVALSRLLVTSEPFMAAGPLPALAAIDIEASDSVELVQSRIRMISVPLASLSLATVGIDAAVVVQANDVLVEENEIEAPDVPGGVIGSAVWGGVQIRGGSVRTIIRGNHITGGVGHGVTLGSVIWQDLDNGGPPRRFGAGKGQIDGTPSTGFGATGTVQADNSFAVLVPLTEGGLTGVVIAENRIEQMSTNGISTFAMLGVFFETDSSSTVFIDLDGLRIEGNTIVDNVAHPPSTIGETGTLVPVAMETPFSFGTPAFAGLQALALGGIVLADVGSGAEIRGNLIRGNGANQAVLPMNGIFIVAGEAISICNNRILENGAPPTGDQADGIRGGIVVLYAGIGAPAGIAEVEDILSQGGNDLANDGSSLRVVNNVVRHPEGRALYVVAAGPVTVTGNFLSSDGFHGSFQDLFALGNIILIQNLGGPWERFDVARLNTTEPAPDGEIFFTDYATPVQAANYLFNVEPDSPRLFVGVGGQVLFQNNQVTFDWALQRQPEEGVPLAIFPVTLMTLDHLSVVGNQFAFRVRNFQGGSAPPDPFPGVVTEPVLAHLFGAGATVDITGNRTSEVFELVYSSIWSLGELVNFTSYNQTTHFNVSEANRGQALTEGNQIMFQRLAFANTNTDQALHLFFQLLFRSSIFPPNRPPPPGAP